MLEINKCKLVPGITANWGEITGDITNQTDLVDYISTHGGGVAAWGSISGNISDQTDLMSMFGEYATQSFVTSALSSYATESWVLSQSYLTTSALSGYATKHWVLNSYTNEVVVEACSKAEGNVMEWVSSQGYLTSSALSGYATESWVTSQGYLTAVPSEYATQSYVTAALSDYATQSWVSSQGYATESWVDNEGYYKPFPGWGPVEERILSLDPDVEDKPEDYPFDEYIDCDYMTIGYCDTGETWRFDGVRIGEEGAGIYTVTPVEDGSEVTYEEEFKPFALDEDLTSLTVRVSSLETNYGDAVTITNNILGV